MKKKSNPPSINEQAFDCPHCGAYTTQYWFDVLSDGRKDNAPPSMPSSEIRELIERRGGRCPMLSLFIWQDNLIKEQVWGLEKAILFKVISRCLILQSWDGSYTDQYKHCWVSLNVNYKRTN